MMEPHYEPKLFDSRHEAPIHFCNAPQLWSHITGRLDSKIRAWDDWVESKIKPHIEGHHSILENRWLFLWAPDVVISLHPGTVLYEKQLSLNSKVKVSIARYTQWERHLRPEAEGRSDFLLFLTLWSINIWKKLFLFPACNLCPFPTLFLLLRSLFPTLWVHRVYIWMFRERWKGSCWSWTGGVASGIITGMRGGKVRFKVIDSIKLQPPYFARAILLFYEHFRRLPRPQKVDYQQLNFSCKDTSTCENMRFFYVIEKEKLTGIQAKDKWTAV